MSDTKKNFDITVTIRHAVFEIHIDSFYPGTNYPIHSGSLEPNDDPEVEYNIISITSPDSDLSLEDLPSYDELDEAIINKCKEE